MRTIPKVVEKEKGAEVPPVQKEEAPAKPILSFETAFKGEGEELYIEKVTTYPNIGRELMILPYRLNQKIPTAKRRVRKRLPLKSLKNLKAHLRDSIWTKLSTKR